MTAHTTTRVGRIHALQQRVLRAARDYAALRRQQHGVRGVDAPEWQAAFAAMERAALELWDEEHEREDVGHAAMKAARVHERRRSGQ